MKHTRCHGRVFVLAALAAIVAKLMPGCTTEPQVDVNIEKGAVKVDPPEINAPITVVLEKCDGGYEVLYRTGADAGQ